MENMSLRNDKKQPGQGEVRKSVNPYFDEKQCNYDERKGRNTNCCVDLLRKERGGICNSKCKISFGNNIFKGRKGESFFEESSVNERNSRQEKCHRGNIAVVDATQRRLTQLSKKSNDVGSSKESAAQDYVYNNKDVGNHSDMYGDDRGCYHPSFETNFGIHENTIDCNSSWTRNTGVDSKSQYQPSTYLDITFDQKTGEGTISDLERDNLSCGYEPDMATFSILKKQDDVDYCKNIVHTDTEQTTTCDSQQNLLDDYRNGFYTNSQNTININSVQYVSDIFHNNVSESVMKPVLFESGNRDQYCSKKDSHILSNINNVHFPYVIYDVNDCHDELKKRTCEGLDNEGNEKAIMGERAQCEMISNEAYLPCMSYADDELSYIEKEKHAIASHGKYVHIANPFNLIHMPIEKSSNMQENDIPKNQKKMFANLSANSDHTTGERDMRMNERENVLTSYNYKFSDARHVNLENNFDMNNTHNNSVMSKLKDGMSHFKGEEKAQIDYHTSFNVQQKNYFLPKGKIYNKDVVEAVHEPCKNLIHSFSGQNEDSSSDSFTTMRTLKGNYDHKNMSNYESKDSESVYHMQRIYKENSHAYPSCEGKDMEKYHPNVSYPCSYIDGCDVNHEAYDQEHDMKTESKGIVNVPIFKKDEIHKAIAANAAISGKAESACTSAFSANNTRENCKHSNTYNHGHPSGREYLKKFLDNKYTVDEIRNCIPEPMLFTKQTFDVPQIIHGLTKKHKNGIVSECKEDTIIEYNNKWRLVKGKRFEINQNENIKSVEESALSFQKYLDEKNDNTKRILINSNFNSLTGKLVINPFYNKENEKVNDSRRIYDYKDITHSFPNYYNIPKKEDQNGNIIEWNRKHDLENITKKNIAFAQIEECSNYKNTYEQELKKRPIIKKQSIALCGDYHLKGKVKEFLYQKVKDCFSINLFNPNVSSA
ncbi:conserved Plasmodium protein, unknown function [Plasmodium ovale]|uniref:Uncharacterized protein n=2 Tax=Plasmodium ovale TaxID=36330 RepID=A0A1A8WZX3_PLAOA|nr:hypothetical protein POVCU2_0037600 [Plasmodium ovale curtisi]SBS96967.1 hypothetical protein POVCU1_034820 [Plasmodium ovale curtisi]SCP05711.1 conserved Plasmodium protein, unknown function [Plasmodium ovale]